MGWLTITPGEAGQDTQVHLHVVSGRTRGVTPTDVHHMPWNMQEHAVAGTLGCWRVHRDLGMLAKTGGEEAMPAFYMSTRACMPNAPFR